jgi:hypothetical protein
MHIDYWLAAPMILNALTIPFWIWLIYDLRRRKRSQAHHG